ncbi:MAG: hypothetical protein Q9182_000324 [Xanthomendoza sp. 2 TL-2023]
MFACRLAVGTLVRALIAAPFVNRLGRSLSMSAWCIVFSVGIIMQMAARMHGVDSYRTSKSAPIHTVELLCAATSCITLGVLAANIKYGTDGISNSAFWRISIGVGFLWAIILSLGIPFFPETLKDDFRKGRPHEAREPMSKVLGVGTTIVRLKCN